MGGERHGGECEARGREADGAATGAGQMGGNEHAPSILIVRAAPATVLVATGRSDRAIDVVALLRQPGELRWSPVALRTRLAARVRLSSGELWL